MVTWSPRGRQGFPLLSEWWGGNVCIFSVFKQKKERKKKRKKERGEGEVLIVFGSLGGGAEQLAKHTNINEIH